MIEPIGDLDACTVRMVDPAKVATIRAALPGQSTIGGLAAGFALLSDPGRLRLLTAMYHAGQICVCDLAAATGMSESAVSHALRLLRAARVVRVQRRGRMAYYRLDDDHVRLLLDVGLAHTRHTAPHHAPSVERAS